MNVGTRDGGYTIVETMIFLVVSAALLVSALLLVSGQQQKTQFTTGLRDFDSKIQDIINNTATGYYTDTGVKCTASPGTAPNLTPGPASNEGKNTGCIYIGQVIQFAPSGTNNQGLRIYSVAGTRQTATAPPQEVQSIQQALPVVIAKGNAASSSGRPDSFEDYTIPGGLMIKRITYDNGGKNTPIGAIGFFSSFAKYAGSKLSSGSTNTQFIAIYPNNTVTSDLSANPKAMVDYYNTALNKPPGANYATVADDVKICLDGGTGQWAILTISGGGDSTTTKVDIYSNKASVPGGLCP